MKLPPRLRDTVDRASTIDIDQDADRTTRIHLNLAFKDFIQLVIGGLIVAVGIAVFIAPHNIAPGGSSGMAIILHHYVPVSIGILMLLFNVPAFLLGYRQLGGSAFLIRSLVGTLTYNIAVDVIAAFVPVGGVTDEMILNAVYGGILGGVGVGIVYRAGGVAGAGGVLNRLLRQRLAWPIRTTTLLTNGAVLLLAGLVFGWEAAMFAAISFFISGSVADFVLEGPDVVQTALVITDHPDRISGALAAELERGVTRWRVEGNEQRHVHTALYCTVTRPEISALKNIVAAVDEDAFVIISQGHEAIGTGFKPHDWRPPVVEEIRE
ncbi:MAG: YitT family protein [Anaerolineales bacterium]|nr:YitT family protein [Anaerolineales bacterium]